MQKIEKEYNKREEKILEREQYIKASKLDMDRYEKAIESYRSRLQTDVIDREIYGTPVDTKFPTFQEFLKI